MSGYVYRGNRAAAPPVNPCGCGCGQDAGVYIRTDRRWGQVKGQPRRYIPGHNRGGQDNYAAANRAREARGWPGTR